MAIGKVLNGKYAGNPHVRFGEGEVASAAMPRRGSLLYKTEKVLGSKLVAFGAFLAVGGALQLHAAESDYKILDWIQSTSGGGQYIDTGIAGQGDVYVETKMQWFEIGKNKIVISSRGSTSTDPRCTPISTQNSQGRWTYNYYGSGSYQMSPYLDASGQGLGVDYTVRAKMCDGFQQLVVYNHNLDATYTSAGTTISSGVFTTGCKFFVFGESKAGAMQYPSLIRVYTMDIYTNATESTNGVLARRFVAAREKATDRVGFYDRVTDAFFPNRGSTPFYYEESGARINVSVAPSPFGTVDPRKGEHVAETANQTYTLSGAVTFDDGVVGYWDSNSVWRAEFDKAVFTPLDGAAEEIAATNFTRAVGSGCSVEWCFKNVACRIGSEVEGPGTVFVGGAADFKWVGVGRTETVRAEPVGNAKFFEWIGDVSGIANTYAPSFRWSNTGPRTFTARFAAIPSEYRLVPWIASTTNGYQYVDSGIEGRSGVCVVADIAWVDVKPPTGRVLVGCRRGTTGNYWFCPIATHGDSISYWALGYAVSGATSGVAINLDGRKAVKAKMVQNAASMEIGGTQKDFNSPDELETGFNMYVFANNRNGSPMSHSTARLYAMQIYTNATAEVNGVLARSFVPVCRRSDDTPGLYDQVSGMFLPSASDTPFVHGEFEPVDPSPGLLLIIR